MVGKIDQMSREEVLAEIAKLQQDFPVLMNATAPTIDMIRGPRDADAPDTFSQIDEAELDEILNE